MSASTAVGTAAVKLLTSAPRGELVSARPPATITAIVDYCRRLLPSGRPRRLARMSEPGEAKNEFNKNTKCYECVPRDKYEDVFEKRLDAPLLAHARGTKTFASTIDMDGTARGGMLKVVQNGSPTSAV